MRWRAIVPCLAVASLAYAGPKPEAELRKLVDVKIKAQNSAAQVEDWFADSGDGMFFMRWNGSQKPDASGLGLGMYISKFKVTSFAAHIAPDGKTAVVSYLIHIKEKVTNDDGGLYQDTDYRVTEIAKQTKDGWRVITGMWSVAEKNAEVNKGAKAGKMPALDALPGGGDKSLVDAVTKLTTGPFDEAATKRKDLVAFGSGPGERTVGGATLAKAWQAAWANKLKVDSTLASNDPKATLGYVLANVTLQKTGYTIPFRVMFVFERKSDTEPWSVVHAHFAVTAPKD